VFNISAVPTIPPKKARLDLIQPLACTELPKNGVESIQLPDEISPLPTNTFTGKYIINNCFKILYFSYIPVVPDPLRELTTENISERSLFQPEDETSTSINLVITLHKP
jgi:hypothetical protein